MYSSTKRRIPLALVSIGIVAGSLWVPLAAQKRVTSETKSLPELGDKPGQVLKVENIKGAVKKVDLEKRTVTVTQSDADTVLSFPTASGREKVSVSKKVEKALGKKSLRLEDLPVGSQVKVAYYPALGTIMQITVEDLAR